MLDRLLQLIIRLKEILLHVEERQQEAHGNEVEIEDLNAELVTLKKDQVDAMKALDDLEEVIKKWES
jgi:predicted  nucleic acid-binding Zn-ribbon protein